MSTKSPTWNAKFEALRLNYVRQLPRLLEQLVADCTRTIEGHSDPEGLARAERQAHTLAGTAGTFQLREISGAARALEDLFVSNRKAARVPEGNSLRLQVAALQGAVCRVLVDGHRSIGGTP